MDYRSVVSPIGLIEIQPLPYEYGINGLLRIILGIVFAARLLSARTVQRRLQQRGLSVWRHYFGLPCQCSLRRDGDSGEPNDEAGYRRGTMSAFKTSPGSACSILMVVYASNAPRRLLLALDISIETMYLV
ncbi:hypothetical protein TNCV_1914381 [Trichonephila clavipes]|nr:hypothetical protein TNCV_1914381 [Trichonephila clavipes]